MVTKMPAAIVILLLFRATKATTTVQRPPSVAWQATMQRQLEEQGQKMANRMDEQHGNVCDGNFNHG
jgi:hypothetical protein